MKKDFSHIFGHDYQGFDNFCQEVLQPMFGLHRTYVLLRGLHCHNGKVRTG